MDDSDLEEEFDGFVAENVEINPPCVLNTESDLELSDFDIDPCRLSLGSPCPKQCEERGWGELT